MKTTGWRSLILYIIGAGFLVGIIFFICSYFIQGGSWAIRPSKAHITNNGQLQTVTAICFLTAKTGYSSIMTMH